MQDAINLLVLYENEDWYGEMPFFSGSYDNDDLRRGYELFARKLAQSSISFYRAAANWYEGERYFAKGWYFDGVQWEKKEGITADLVWDKTPWREPFITTKRRLINYVPVLNHPDLDEVCSDKMKTYEWFEEMMPISYKAFDESSYNKFLKRIPGDWVVVKPVDGSSGMDVYVGAKKDVVWRDNQTMLVQEFIDTSKGFAGLVDGVADLRVVMADGKIVYTYIRKAKRGSWVSNVSFGAERILLTIEQIPPQILAYVRKIDNRLRVFDHRFYTADFVIDSINGQAKLIELNSKPRLGGELESPEFARYCEKVIEVLKQLPIKR